MEKNGCGIRKKNHFLCSTKEQSYRFRMAWEWINDGRVFEWTSPVSFSVNFFPSFYFSTFSCSFPLFIFHLHLSMYLIFDACPLLPPFFLSFHLTFLCCSSLFLSVLTSLPPSFHPSVSLSDHSLLFGLPAKLKMNWLLWSFIECFITGLNNAHSGREFFLH